VGNETFFVGLDFSGEETEIYAETDTLDSSAAIVPDVVIDCMLAMIGENIEEWLKP
jgi:hypothetical protein